MTIIAQDHGRGAAAQGQPGEQDGPSPVGGALLWEPSVEARTRSTIARYLGWLRERRSLAFPDYDALWRWSVTDLEGFWSSVWEFFQVQAHRPYECVLADRRMPGARWFPGAELNYAEHALRRRDDHLALIAESESRPLRALTYAELRAQVAAVAAGLRTLGVRQGDRVVAYLPNIPETVVAFLATSSLGAVWASCPPEFGLRSVVDRFRQIAPRVLLAVDGYRFKGAAHDRRNEVRELRAGLPTLLTQ